MSLPSDTEDAGVLFSLNKFIVSEPSVITIIDRRGSLGVRIDET